MHVYPIIIQPLAFTAYFILILLPVTGSVGENQGRKIHSGGGKVPFFFFSLHEYLCFCFTTETLFRSLKSCAQYCLSII